MRKNLLMKKATTKIKRPEQTTQIGVFSHLTPLMAAHRHKKFLAFHYPAGGGRSGAEAGILKAMGTMSGVADIIILLDGGKTVFVELKLRTMVLCKRGPLKGQMVAKCTEQSDDQILFMDRVRALGFPYHLVEATDISDALNKILDIIKTEGGFEW